MTLPLDLVLVRHGQSEGNAAKRRSEGGDHSAYSSEFRDQHSGSYRLTELGCEQARRTGHWLMEEFIEHYRFDRYYTSAYTRAMETAGLLGLHSADWLVDHYLTERDWGDISSVPEDERQKRFGKELEMRTREPFFWSPPNGESFTDLCLRIDRVLDTLHRECGDKRVLIVCHGEVMRGFQVRLERLPQQRFRELVLSEKPEDRIHNCEVMHYTRRNPHGGRELRPYLGWVRKVRAAENPQWTSGWKPIERQRFTNMDLMQEVRQHPTFLR